MKKEYTVEQLREMKPLEVAMAFKRAGGWGATKSSFLGKPEALREWRTAHPAFSDPQVASLLEAGKAEVFARTIREVGQALAGTDGDGTATIFGLTGHGEIVETHVAAPSEDKIKIRRLGVTPPRMTIGFAVHHFPESAPLEQTHQ